MLVKFDKQYAYGDAEDAFKETAEKVGALKTKLIVAEVGKQEYGDEENKALHERYTIDKDAWPVYKLFPAVRPVLSSRVSLPRVCVLTAVRLSASCVVSAR